MIKKIMVLSVLVLVSVQPCVCMVHDYAREVMLERKLDQSIFQHNVDGLKDVVERDGVDINSEIGSHKNPFYHACYLCARFGEKGDIVDYLLTIKNIDPNKPSASGETPLQCVCQESNVELVKRLVKGECVEIDDESRRFAQKNKRCTKIYGYLQDALKTRVLLNHVLPWVPKKSLKEVTSKKDLIEIDKN